MPAASETAATAAAVRTTPVGPVTFAQVKDAWPEVLEAVKVASLNAWMVVFTAQVRELRDDDVLVLGFPSQKDVAALKQQAAPGQGVGDHLKRAVSDILGFTPKLIARVETPGGPGGPRGTPDVTTPPVGDPGGAAATGASSSGAPATPAASPSARTQTPATAHRRLRHRHRRHPPPSIPQTAGRPSRSPVPEHPHRRRLSARSSSPAAEGRTCGPRAEPGSRRGARPGSVGPVR